MDLRIVRLIITPVFAVICFESLKYNIFTYERGAVNYHPDSRRMTLYLLLVFIIGTILVSSLFNSVILNGIDPIHW